MKTLLTALTISHVLAGILALFVGLIPMFAPKGGRLHNRAGLVYVWCMLFVGVTALGLCGLQPFRMTRLFLAGVAVLSLFLCLSGWRATKHKAGNVPLPDRALRYAALGTGLAMAGFGTYLIVRDGPLFLPIVFTFFGLLMTRFAVEDIRQLRRPVEKTHWFFQHFTRMGGSYIATFTAAVVTNLHRLAPEGAPDWLGTLVWIAPSLLGGLLIRRTVARYRRKFAVQAPGAAQRVR